MGREFKYINLLIICQFEIELTSSSNTISSAFIFEHCQRNCKIHPLSQSNGPINLDHKI